jgi:hypothetical protein
MISGGSQQADCTKCCIEERVQRRKTTSYPQVPAAENSDESGEGSKVHTDFWRPRKQRATPNSAQGHVGTGRQVDGRQRRVEVESRLKKKKKGSESEDVAKSGIGRDALNKETGESKK